MRKITEKITEGGRKMKDINNLTDINCFTSYWYFYYFI